MRRFAVTFVLGLLIVQCLSAAPMQDRPQAFDTNSPLESRVTDTPQRVLDSLVKQHVRMPTRHPLSQEERTRVLADLSMLPSFERRALQSHVRSISFVDGLTGNGTTIQDSTDTATTVDIVIHPIVLTETVSQFLTRKERSCYQPSETHLDLSVNAGSLDAILYVLLHEAMHVVDIRDHASTTQDSPPALAADYWKDLRTRRAPYDSGLLGKTCFFSRWPLSTDIAPATYQALGQSPFVSLYATTDSLDDSAELVAMYHLTQVLHQPYNIVLRREQQTIVSLSPMDSPLVKARFPAVNALYP